MALNRKYLRSLCQRDHAAWAHALDILDHDESISEEDKPVIKKFYEDRKQLAERQYNELGAQPQG